MTNVQNANTQSESFVFWVLLNVYLLNSGRLLPTLYYLFLFYSHLNDSISPKQLILLPKCLTWYIKIHLSVYERCFENCF